MSILSIYEEQNNYNFSPEFEQKLIEIKPDVEAMVLADKQMKHHRMKVIAELVKHRQMTVNPDDKAAIRKMLGTWTTDVVDNCCLAYREYERLLATNVPEYVELANSANPTQLLVLGKGRETSLAYDAAKALKKTGKIPTAAELRGHLGGYKNSKFENTNHRINTVKPEPVKPKPVTTPVFKEQQVRIDEVLADPNKPAIDDAASARAYASHAGIYPEAKAFLQLIKDTNAVSPQTDAVLREIRQELLELQQRGFKSRTDDTYKYYIGDAVEVVSYGDKVVT